MGLNNNQIPVYGITPKTSVGTIATGTTAGTLGTTTNAVTVATAGSNGCIIDALVASTTSAAAINLFVSIVDSAGTGARPLGIVAVPANSGNTSGNLAVDVINAAVLVGMTVDQNGKRIIRLGANETLRVAMAGATLTGIVYVSAQFTDL
jgi:hypothetical protein